jgi:multidrug transporter EmrE-like cation transporter
MSALLRASMLLNALILGVMLAFSHGLLKWVARKQVASYVDLIAEYWLPIGTSLAIYAALFFYYIQVLRHHDIGILYSTYTGISILLVLLTGLFFFGENLTRMQLLGCGLVILGIFFIGKP